MLSFFSFKLHTFTHKVNGSSAYYKVVFLVLLFISWSVVSCPPRIYLSCYLWCLALWQALSRRRPQSEAGAGPSQRPAPAPVRPAVDYCFQLLQLPSYATLKYAIVSYSLFSAILNRRGGWLPTLAGFTLGAIAEPLLGAMQCVPLLGAIVGAMAGCHCSVPLPDASYQLQRSSRWVPLLGAIARSHCLGAIVRCHCWVPLLVCHCWVPLWGAMAGCHCHCWCHCWMPLLVPLLRAIARNHCEKKLTRVLHRSPLPFSLH